MSELTLANKKGIQGAVTTLAEYWNTYSTQPEYKNYSVGTLVNDALYGIGIAIDPWLYKEADGYARFKKDLTPFINQPKPSNLAGSSEELLNNISNLRDKNDQLSKENKALSQLLVDWKELILSGIIYEADGKYLTGVRGDTDVTDIVKTLIQAEAIAFKELAV